MSAISFVHKESIFSWLAEKQTPFNYTKDSNFCCFFQSFKCKIIKKKVLHLELNLLRRGYQGLGAKKRTFSMFILISIIWIRHFAYCAVQLNNIIYLFIFVIEFVRWARYIFELDIELWLFCEFALTQPNWVVCNRSFCINFPFFYQYLFLLAFFYCFGVHMERLHFFVTFGLNAIAFGRNWFVKF